MKHLARITSVILLLVASAAQGQTLMVHLGSGVTEIYPLAGIGSITFPAGQMSVNFSDGTQASWPIADIRSYAFGDLNTGMDAHGLAQASLRAYPNPSSGLVRIALHVAGAERARVDVVDLTGRSIELVFDGPLPADGLSIEHVCAFASGPCMVRATTTAGTIVLPLIIQR